MNRARILPESTWVSAPGLNARETENSKKEQNEPMVVLPGTPTSMDIQAQHSFGWREGPSSQKSWLDRNNHAAQLLGTDEAMPSPPALEDREATDELRSALALKHSQASGPKSSGMLPSMRVMGAI
jgi:hypothetical protein